MRIGSPVGRAWLPDYMAGVMVCIDLGAEVSLISERMVQVLKIPTYCVKTRFKTTSFTGKDVEWVTRKASIRIIIKNCVVRIKCYVGPLVRKEHILLGMLFLRMFKPRMDWEHNKITCWDDGFVPNRDTDIYIKSQVPLYEGYAVKFNEDGSVKEPLTSFVNKDNFVDRTRGCTILEKGGSYTSKGV